MERLFSLGLPTLAALDSDLIRRFKESLVAVRSPATVRGCAQALAAFAWWCETSSLNKTREIGGSQLGEYAVFLAKRGTASTVVSQIRFLGKVLESDGEPAVIAKFKKNVKRVNVKGIDQC